MVTIGGTPDVRAAATGRVRARGEAPDEAAALALLASIEGVVGPAPWAFVLEPAEEGSPWEVRVDLPDPGTALGVAALPGVALEPAEPPGLVEALDRGWLAEEREVLSGVVVRRLLDGDEARQPDLHRARATDPELARLEGVLAAAAAPFPLVAEDRGAALIPIVHRPTGRVGVECWVGGDALPERRRVLEALAAAVATEPLLVPELGFDESMGALVVRAWLAVPAAAGLPADADLADEPHDPAWWGDRIGHAPDVELQVVPDPAAHDAVVEAVGALLGAADLAGGPPRWVTIAGARRFAASWVGELPDAAVLAAARAVPGVERVRVVAGVPYGLDATWPVLEPAWRTVAGVHWQRCHDPVPDRDRWEEVTDRDADDRDHAAADAVTADVRPILDSSGRRGLEVRGGPEAFAEAGLVALLRDAATEHPGLSRIGTFAFDRRGAVARRWWRDGVDPGARRWVIAR